MFGGCCALDVVALLLLLLLMRCWGRSADLSLW